MQSNKLSSLSGGGALSDLSLLTVLDIRNNSFACLPVEIMHLTSLQVRIVGFYHPDAVDIVTVFFFFFSGIVSPR